MPRLARPGLLAVLCALGACTGQIGDEIQGALLEADAAVGGGGSGGALADGAVEQPPSPALAACAGKIDPGRSPLRRLTRFELDNSVRDLLSDTTSPGSQLPSEVLASSFDLFGNNADAQSVSWPLIKAYNGSAAEIAARATQSASVMAELEPCTSSLTAENQDACARKLIERFTRRAYRRVVSSEEVDELFALSEPYSTPFEKGIATVIEAVLQSPDFLYRLEWGVADAAQPNVLRPSGDEMATRLAYTLWGTAPDDALRAAADAGELDTAAGVRARATTMVEDPRTRRMVRFFFDKLLPIEGLADVTRDAKTYPKFSPAIGSYMHEETQRFLEAEIFENAGTWKSILTAPYTYVNSPLAEFYGIAGVSGDADTYEKTPLDISKRMGLIMQGSVMTGTIPTNTSNPVRRGGFVLNQLLCRHLSLPTDPAILEQVKVPEVDGNTARERFTQHSQQMVCRGCHESLDPIGFALETFDAVGQYRETDNGYPIDASGTFAGIGSFNNAIDLVNALAESDEIYDCFVTHWLELAHGHLLDPEKDLCVAERMEDTFARSGYNVKQLLIELTQSDAFLYMPAVKE